MQQNVNSRRRAANLLCNRCSSGTYTPDCPPDSTACNGWQKEGDSCGRFRQIFVGKLTDRCRIPAMRRRLRILGSAVARGRERQSRMPHVDVFILKATLPTNLTVLLLVHLFLDNRDQRVGT
ncbi:hypothetical protein F2P81_021922 [Scophthalmus maximus]|uniref:Uncharacterized protein n=1 Tax=Scophthalmus maximus TaxID=52904 RepID=A0A6A4S1H4_SCOMX|nr:hypothetical protein F2P81_021922 [Scophthalmus maximus]